MNGSSVSLSWENLIVFPDTNFIYPKWENFGNRLKLNFVLLKDVAHIYFESLERRNITQLRELTDLTGTHKPCDPTINITIITIFLINILQQLERILIYNNFVIMSNITNI